MKIKTLERLFELEGRALINWANFADRKNELVLKMFEEGCVVQFEKTCAGFVKCVFHTPDEFQNEAIRLQSLEERAHKVWEYYYYRRKAAEKALNE